ncbi:MAG: peptidase T, partial [Anaerolineae bacterium]|nr:peptidase T [Anaerolineae bacterium]
MASVKERFLSYVKVNTTSNLESETNPSTPEQFNLAHMLVEEMKALGLEDVSLDENCYIMATLPANTSKKIPTMGLIAHLDTSPDMSGEGVK